MLQVLQSAPVVAHFQKVVNELAMLATGSATRIARLHVMHEPPSIDKGEVTDKGSVNQRAVLTHRRVLVEALHADAVQPIFKPNEIQATS
jgi:feruloyl-CoA synthase